ncbi:MAG TPA: efflux RND transporter periplasmic adaptor subunit [Steroidobacteraceae bacterium]|nr:efflux RND transporter periplasmic adaptor subunit [Steroidobacteraceae bacterium]
MIAIVSVGLAVVCAGWAIYESKHDTPADNNAMSTGGVGAAQAAIRVVTAPVRERSLDVGLEAIGTAGANEAVDITAKTSNIITAIHFTDGQRVQQGQVMVELDRGTAEADLAAATAAFEESRSQFGRSRELLATQALSKAQHEQLEATMKSNEARVAAARSRLSDTYIRAPFTGHVGLRRVSVGALISPGTLITTLDDTSTIKVDFSVPEAQVGALKAGQTVGARTNAYPGRQFNGRVLSVDSRVDPATRSVIVRAAVPNADLALKPGMYLTVALSQDQRPALVIPEEALVPEQARQFVYLVRGDTVEKREVTLGRRQPGFVEITDGVRAGDRVVIEGTMKLRDGSLVRDADAPSAAEGAAEASALAPGRQPS